MNRPAAPLVKAFARVLMSGAVRTGFGAGAQKLENSRGISAAKATRRRHLL
jgi:hypothetical protein